MNLGERAALDFFTSYGMRAERFSKEEIGRTRTPDFRVFKGQQLVSYCEAKHVRQDDWLDNQMTDARPLEIAGGAHPDPIFNRLTTHIHEAAGQFEAVNPTRDHPNILVFANSDRLCKFLDLIRILTGNEYTDTGEVEPIFTQYSEGRIRTEKHKVDLYVWKDLWQGGNPRIRFFYVLSSVHYGKLCELFGSDPAMHRTV
ncbi:MAG: hypothetical protein L0338_35995 [Acidobacteria bacterium]|nr:hypothetical protein [Acidobacteriota bacterium]